jgi:hypothetical protein
MAIAAILCLFLFNHQRPGQAVRKVVSRKPSSFQKEKSIRLKSLKKSDRDSFNLFVESDLPGALRTITAIVSTIYSCAIQRRRPRKIEERNSADVGAPPQNPGYRARGASKPCAAMGNTGAVGIYGFQKSGSALIHSSAT